ncbi:hypothetical protein [Shimia sp. MIT1388]|uniref:hypothetical protein n=1 Tax=Shimia sp. MIT1388 TaxID=3096992 RepID=UPI00399B05A9
MITTLFLARRVLGVIGVSLWLSLWITAADGLLLTLASALALFLAEICSVKILILFRFPESCWNSVKRCKKRLRLFGVMLRTPFTGGAEAHNGGTDWQGATL